MKYFRFKFGHPGYRIFLRIVFPIGKRNDIFYHMGWDAKVRGPHVYGYVIELGWKAKRPLFFSCTSWSYATGAYVIESSSIAAEEFLNSNQ